MMAKKGRSKGGSLVQAVFLILMGAAYWKIMSRLRGRKEENPGPKGIEAVVKRASLDENSMEPARPRELSCQTGRLQLPRDFWFVKTKKVGGSTLADVMEAISERYGVEPIPSPEDSQGMGNPEQAIVLKELTERRTGADHFSLFHHIKYDPDLRDRIFKDPLLFTAVRHPLSQAYSQYYFRHNRDVLCKRDGNDPEDCWDDTPEEFVTFLSNQENFAYQYLRGKIDNGDAQAVMNQYDFVFVTERFDESLVLFMLQYGFQMEDIYYLKSKKNRVGQYPTARDKSDAQNNYTLAFYSIDLKLWDIANERLDRLREELSARCGPHVVEVAMQKFAAMREK